MKYRIYAGITLIIILAAAIFGFYKRRTFTDICKESDYMEQLSVAELPEQFIQRDYDQMINELPNARYILQVKVLENIEFLFGTSRQKVLVEFVHAGDNINPGDEIYLTGRSSLSVRTNPETIECDFINIPMVGYQYLVFCNEAADTLDHSLPVYRLCQDSFIAPIFCYEDFNHVILPTDDESTYVPYSEVKNNEFFAASEAGFQIWNELKKNMLLLYPYEN